MIHNIMEEGKLVPSELTVKLIQKAISETDNDKFLIDGFPRNEENVTTFENLVSYTFVTDHAFCFLLAQGCNCCFPL